MGPPAIELKKFLNRKQLSPMQKQCAGDPIKRMEILQHKIRDNKISFDDINFFLKNEGIISSDFARYEEREVKRLIMSGLFQEFK